jgi:hypothetical protein
MVERTGYSASVDLNIIALEEDDTIGQNVKKLFNSSGR